MSERPVETTRVEAARVEATRGEPQTAGQRGLAASTLPLAHFRIRRLELTAFKCVESASVELGPGLNVLYGPNDLGKSSLGEALRAVLLLPPTSSDRKEFEVWGRDQAPLVKLRFDHEGAHYRLMKTWGEGARGTAMLERSEDGHVWSTVDNGRAVDGTLRKMLGWGVREPGGKGAPKGLPKSFITTALLAASSRIDELFADDLAQDTDSRGRERLAEALQSLAEDPLFKRMLDEAQAQVDKTKDSRGNFRRAKDLPLGRIAERIRTLGEQLEELERQAQQGDSVAEVLRTARQRRAALREELAAAEAEKLRRRAAFEASAAWRAAADAVAAQQQVVAAHEAEQARLQALVDEATATREQVRAALDEQQRCAAATAEATEALRLASEQLAAIERSDATVVARAELGARELEIGRRRQSLVEVRARVGDALALDRDAATASAAATQATGALRAIEHAAVAKQKDLSRATADHRRLVARLAAARWRDATTRLAAVERQVADARAAGARARLLREAASARQAELARTPPPDAATLTALRELDTRRRRAEDQAAVGFAVTLDASGAAPTIAVDGQATAAAPGSTITARRDMTIVIPGWGTLVVEAGSVELRTELAAATDRWRSDAAPILAAHGAASYDALAELADRWNAARAQCERELADAAALEREAAAAGVDEATIATTRAELERAAAAAIEHADAQGEPSDILARLVDGLATQTIDAIDRERVQAEHAMQALRAEQAELDLQIARATTTATERRRIADEAVARADAARGVLAPVHAADLVTAAAELDDELAALERATAEVTRALEQLTSSRASAARSARDLVTKGTAELEQMRVAQREAELRTSSLREAAAAAEGRLAEARATAATHDRAAAQAELERLQRVLATLPAPTLDVDATSLDEADLAIERIVEQTRLVDAEMQKAEGNLEHLGGTNARARVEEMRANLEASRRAEAEMQREIEGWQMLRDTMRAVETEQGRHVGDALASAVESRLRTLTHDRYGRLDLDRDLKTHGVRVAGSPRAITALSAGLKEQVATLVRLAVAEHLDATLVLDDHLAQTDPTRVDFFRGLLRAVGERVQILVLTCRPLDYLEPGELATTDPIRDAKPNVRAIDLERVISRLAISAG
jgi:hypothetical protein